MKVLFTNPPWYKTPTATEPGWRGVRAGSRWPHTFPVHSHTIENGLIKEHVGGYLPFPVWLATAAAYAKKEGFETIIRDSLSMGETYESFYAFVENCRPDVIVLETSTPTVRIDLGMAAKMRTLVPGVRILFTGLHVELEQEEFLSAHPEIDFTIYGEYEDPTIKLLHALREGTPLSTVPSLIYRQGDTVFKSGGHCHSDEEKASSSNGQAIQVVKTSFAKLPELAVFPWAEREGMPNLNYFDGVCGLERPQLQLMATRGCPFGCIFCAWPQMLFRGPRYRKRSAQDVVDEIKANLEKIPYKSIYIDDDTFNISKEYVIELASKLKEAGIGGKIPWSTMGRADLMDERTLSALRDAGLFSIKYGVESADQDILDEIDKRVNLEKNIRMIRLTKEYGIRVHLTFTFGLPSDTVETIERTIELACSLPADTVQFSIATPFPGTEMYRLYDEKGWLVSKDWDHYNGSTVAVCRTENFTAEELEFYVAEAYRRFNEAQVTRSLTTGPAFTRLSEAASELSSGDQVIVLQTSRVPFTRWIVNTLKDRGLDVHLATPLRFQEQFAGTLPQDRIHAFSGHTHFQYDALRAWAGQLHGGNAFKGVFIPYTFESRDGYQDVEKLAGELGGRLIGITQQGNLFNLASERQAA